MISGFVGIIIGFLANMILNKILNPKSKRLASSETANVAPYPANIAPAVTAAVPAGQADNTYIAVISAAVAEYRKNNL